MRRALAAIAASALLACALGSAAGAQHFPDGDTLPGAMIPDLISGSWEADPSETPEDARGTLTCDQNPELIRIVETETGPVFEYKRGNMENAVTLRSNIHFLTRSIWLAYDLEWRTTETGDLVEWFLFMPDEDHFFMARRDQIEGGSFLRSTMRRRCPDEIS